MERSRKPMVRISTPCRRKRYWKPLSTMASAPSPITLTMPKAKRAGAVGYKATDTTGPISAGRMIRLHTRPACVSSAITSLCNDFASIFSSRLTSLPSSQSGSFVAHLLPGAHVSNSLLVAFDHDLSSLGDRDTVLTAGAADAAGPDLRVNDFAGSTFADGTGNPAEHADHLVIGGIHVLLVRHQHLAQEQKNDAAAGEAAKHREQQSQADPHRREAREQVSGAAKPRQEGRERDEVKRRNAAAAGRRIPPRCVRCRRAVRRCWRVTACHGSMSHRTMHRRQVPGVSMKMRQVQASKTRSAKDERKETEAEADRETD